MITVGRIRLQLNRVELITQSEIEDAGDDCVNPVLGMPVRHQLHALGNVHPDRVRSVLRGFTYNNRKTQRRWKCCERLPVDLFGKNCSENVLSTLMRANCSFRFFRGIAACLGDIEPLFLSYCGRGGVWAKARLYLGPGLTVDFTRPPSPHQPA
jgi:hypothetical protein